MTGRAESVARVWTRGAAIRPVPAYAVVPEATLRSVEEDLADETGSAPSTMDGAFDRFEATQPEIAARIQDVLDHPLDETALALGYFLSIAVWLAFDRAFGARLGVVTGDAWHATVDALVLEENLRQKNADEPLDLDDVLALEQPDVIAFVHDHIDAALDTEGLCDDVEAYDASASSDEAPASPREVDVDDVHVVYRMILLETLALSHAVAAGPDEASTELLA